MKRAVILHGTDGSPEGNWLPWLKAGLENRGYEVWVPNLPNNHAPNRKVYNDFLFNSEWDFKDNLVIGHSSGAVSILNLLEDSRCPRIKTGVLVGAWARMDETDLDREQFRDLFPQNGFDFEAIKSKTGKLLFLHGDDDPYCPLEQAKWLAEHTGSEIIVIPGGQHLGSNYPKFPELINALEERNLL
ncbi:MAG TPA: alpha/beta hydrolase [Candidatus Saccharimonadales bacterium]|nr:alpha/beta hydrolase [Candidatus Saccharimonadales bacterium]